MRGTWLALLVGTCFGARPLTAAETLVRGQPLAYWMERLKEGETLRRQDAAEAIGGLGADSAAAIPLLAEALRHTRLERPAIRALARIGPKAVPALVACLVDHEGHDTDHVGAFAGAGTPVVPALRLALRHRDLGVRQRAAQALERMGPRGRAAIPDLVRMLQDRRPSWRIPAETVKAPWPGMPDVTLRRFRVFDLDEYGSWASRDALASMGVHAVPALVAVLRDRPLSGRFRKLTWLLRPACNVDGDKSNFDSSEEIIVCAAVLPRDAPRLLESFRAVESAPRREAARALARVGPAARAAVPTLIEALRDEDLPTRIEAAAALGAIGPTARTAAPALRTMLADERLATSSEAIVSALLALGPAAEKEWLRQAVPILAARLNTNDWDICNATCEALQALGPRARAALPALREALGRAEDDELLTLSRAARAIDPDAALRLLLRAPKRPSEYYLVGLACALGDFGPRSRAAIPTLRRLTKHPETRVRVRALLALVRVDTRPEVQVSTLLRLLREPGVGANESVSLFPLLLDHKAKPAFPKLQAALADRESTVALVAACTLLRLGAPPREPLARLHTLLTRGDGETLTQTHAALRALGPLARPLAPVLVKQLHGDADTRLQAAWTLSKMGSEQARQAEPILLGLLRESEGHQEKVVAVLADLGRVPPAAAVPLANLLLRLKKEWADATSRAALTLLKRLGPDAAPAVPALRAFAFSERNPDKYMAVCALGWLRATATVPTLMELLYDSDPQYRAAAAAALGRMGPAGWRAAQRLGGMLHDEDASVRAAVAGALLEWTGDRAEFAPRVAREVRRVPESAFALLTAGTAADVALPALRAALKDRDEGVRRAAIKELAEQGPTAGEAIPDLVALLEDPSREVREAAALALTRMGPAARAAMPGLRRRIRDGDMDGFLVTLHVLGKIADGAAP